MMAQPASVDPRETVATGVKGGLRMRKTAIIVGIVMLMAALASGCYTY